MKLASILLLLAGIVGTAAAADYAKFSSAGHPKAAGLGVVIDYPATWTSKDNDEENVVREFRDPATQGRDALMLVVMPATERKPTAEEFCGELMRPETAERIFPGSRQRRCQLAKDLSYPGVVFDYDLEIAELAPAVVQVRNYVLLVDGRMVQLQFYGVAPPQTDLRTARQELMTHVAASLKAAPSAK